MPGTEKDFATFVTIEGVPEVQKLEAAGFSGGKITGDDTAIHEPGQEFETALGGNSKVEPVTVKWFWKDEVELVSKATIHSRGSVMIVARHKRNPDLSIVAAPYKTYRGIVHEMTDPDHDSGSSTATEFAIEMQAADVR